jgi:hypothetical protein
MSYVALGYQHRLAVGDVLVRARVVDDTASLHAD